MISDNSPRIRKKRAESDYFSTSARVVRGMFRPPPPSAYRARLLSCGYTPVSQYALNSSVYTKDLRPILVMCTKRLEPDIHILMAIIKPITKGWMVRKANKLESSRYRRGMIARMSMKKKYRQVGA